MTIRKTTFTFTVLHEEPLPHSIDDVLEETDTGNAVGAVTGMVTVDVADDRVEGELLALGNDGTFFEKEDDQ